MQQQPIGPAAPPGRTSRALVTGATAGLGLAFARALAGRGHRLVLVARDAERLQAVAGELMHRWHVDATVLVADLSTEDGTARVAAVLADDSVPVDVLVNSAGFGQRLPFGDNDVSAEQRSLDVHVRAPLLLCHAVLPGMRARGHGVIVNVSSIASWLPRGTYGAHKAWLTSFTRWLDIAYRLEGVRAIAVCPGLVHTEFHQRVGVDMAGVPRWMWLDADSVVSEALRDLAAGVRVSVPSRRYRLLMRLAAVVPDGWVAGVARRGR